MFSIRRCVIPLVLLALARRGLRVELVEVQQPAPDRAVLPPAELAAGADGRDRSEREAIKGVNAFAGRFPFASLGEAALKSKLQQSGVNYDGDIRPLLGNPVAFGATGSTLSGAVAEQLRVRLDDQGRRQAEVADQEASRASRRPVRMTGRRSTGAAARRRVALDGATVVLAPTHRAGQRRARSPRPRRRHDVVRSTRRRSPDSPPAAC